MKKVLFVDDEPRVLQGLRRMLHNLRQEWQMTFVESGQQALQTLEQDTYDVVVSDMRMPGMDGAQLLDEVMKRYPAVVRIILSGQSDQDSILRCVGKAHQFLSKPCEADTLVTTIIRTCAMRELMTSSSLKELISQIHRLPSLPSLYLELVEELKAPEPSLKKVAAIISKDLGMTAKILQMVNSSFFGFYNHVTSPERAVAVLGLKTVAVLVLSAHVFSQFDRSRIRVLQIEELMNHSVATGAYARGIALAEHQNQEGVDDALTAGLLHDVGRLVLSANMPERYLQIINVAQTHDIPLWRAEREILGTTHAEVGAYLLGLWGLPRGVVEALTFHHYPSRYLYKGFSLLTAVHVADALHHELSAGQKGSSLVHLNMDYLHSLDITKRLPEWRQLCGNIKLEKATA